MTSSPPVLAAAGFGMTVAALCALLRLRRLRRADSTGNALLDGVNHVFADKPLMDDLNIELDTKMYVDLLRKLMGEAKHVQNAPPDHIPQEDKVVDHIVNCLKPYSKDNGGPLEVRTISYVKGKCRFHKKVDVNKSL